MWPISCIEKKRYGQKLPQGEIQAFVEEYVNGTIPDYQMAAWLMAVCIQGMDYEETVALTLAMAHSGHILDLSEIKGIKVDKHSTGGIADTVTLIAAPLAAAGGVPIAKMSGRGLGFTGGTIDKLEAIPGFQTALTESAFCRQVQEIGIALMQQSEDIAAADKKMYALRDTTGTVASIPLIASSIMSKKIAAGADKIVLDVKYGSGAFMQTWEEGEELARTMVSIGKLAGKETAAVLSDMEMPLGLAIGNSVEVDEAVQVLQGKRTGRLYEAAAAVAGIMLYMGNRAESMEEGALLAKEMIADGRGLAKFTEWLSAQGGNTSWIGNEPLTKAEQEYIVRSETNGYIASYAGRQLGDIVMRMGAGRAKKDDEIDPNAGLILKKEVGEAIEQGEILAVLYAKSEIFLKELAEEVRQAVTITKERPEPYPIIKKIIAE